MVIYKEKIQFVILYGQKYVDNPTNDGVHVFPVKDNANAVAYKHIVDNCALLILWKQFGEGPLLLQHDCVSHVHEGQLNKDVV